MRENRQVRLSRRSYLSPAYLVFVIGISIKYHIPQFHHFVQQLLQHVSLVLDSWFRFPVHSLHFETRSYVTPSCLFLAQSRLFAPHAGMLLEATHCTSVISFQQVCFESNIYCDPMNEQELDWNEKGMALLNSTYLWWSRLQTRKLETCSLFNYSPHTLWDNAT